MHKEDGGDYGRLGIMSGGIRINKMCDIESEVLYECK